MSNESSMSLPEALKRGFDEYFENTIKYAGNEEYTNYINSARSNRSICKVCNNIGAKVIDRYLDGGGPGNFWISKLKCHKCGHTAEDAYHDGSEWKLASYEEWKAKNQSIINKK